MSDAPTPTPETDAALYPMNQVDIVWPEFARKLERERDEARKQRDRLAITLRELCQALLTGKPRDITELLNKTGDALQSLTTLTPTQPEQTKL